MAEDFVGTKRWVRRATPYEVFMEEQNLPIHRGTVGFYDIRDLTLAAWKRIGAQGAFIELNGCGGLQGVYIVEVPGAGTIIAEKHMYEEVFYVLEGRGTSTIYYCPVLRETTLSHCSSSSHRHLFREACSSTLILAL